MKYGINFSKIIMSHNLVMIPQMWTGITKCKFSDICSWLNDHDVNLSGTSGIIMMNITVKGKIILEYCACLYRAVYVPSSCYLYIDWLIDWLLIDWLIDCITSLSRLKDTAKAGIGSRITNITISKYTNLYLFNNMHLSNYW